LQTLEPQLTGLPFQTFSPGVPQLDAVKSPS
jgi:hypothetical protein